MALKGVLRPGYIQIRVTDLDTALTHYVDRVGLHEVSREADGRVYLRAWDEFDRHSIVLRQADKPGMDYAGFKVASDSDLDTFARRIGSKGDFRPRLLERVRTHRSRHRLRQHLSKNLQWSARMGRFRMSASSRKLLGQSVLCALR